MAGESLPIQGYQNVDLLTGGSDRRVRKAYLKKVVAAPDAGLIILMGKDMVARS